MAPQNQHGAPASAFALALASTAEAASKEATTTAATSAAAPRMPGAGKSAAKPASAAVALEEPMPTDKLLDVSPLALRMSSPFNAGYWLAAAA